MRAIRGLSAFVLAAGLMACQPTSDAASSYVTAVAEIGDVRDVVPATGILIAPGGAEVRAQTTGIIARVLVEEGDWVEAGQLLATLQAATVEQTHDEAAATGAAAQAAVRQAEVAVRNRRADRDRTAALVERGFSSRAALAAANGAVEQAEAALDQAQAEARASGARMARAASDATASEIRASVAGVIALSRARPGLQVSPADAQPLFQTVRGLDEMQLEILIPEPDMGRVGTDSRVSFTVDAYPDLRNDATLISIGQAPVREGRFVSYRALASAPNPGGQLLPGMSASVELVRADSRRVMRIPARAIYFRPENYMPPLTDEELEALQREFHGNMNLVRAAAGGSEFGRLFRRGKRLIFSLRDGELVRHEVTIGAETDEFVEVREGLQGGEVIVVGRRPPPEPTAR